MNDLWLEDINKTGSPDDVKMMTCQHCGDPINGSYYSIEDEVYCEKCITDFCFGRAEAPDVIQFAFRELIDEFKEFS